MIVPSDHRSIAFYIGKYVYSSSGVDGASLLSLLSYGRRNEKWENLVHSETLFCTVWKARTKTSGNMKERKTVWIKSSYFDRVVILFFNYQYFFTEEGKHPREEQRCHGEGFGNLPEVWKQCVSWP